MSKLSASFFVTASLQLEDFPLKFKELSFVLDSTQDFKVILACIRHLAKLTDEYLSQQSFEVDDNVANTIKLWYRKSADMCDHLSTRNHWLLRTAAYSTPVDQLSSLRWPEDALYLDAVRELDRVLRPAQKYNFLHLMNTVTWSHLLGEEIAFVWAKFNWMPSDTSAELFMHGVDFPQLISADPQPFLEASRILSNYPLRRHGKDQYNSIGINGAISRNVSLGGQKFFLGFRNRDDISLRRAASHFESMIDFFRGDSIHPWQPVEVSDFSEDASFSTIFHFLEKNKHKRTGEHEYRVYVQENGIFEAWTVELPWSEGWLVQTTNPADRAAYRHDPIEFVRNHPNEFKDSAALRFWRDRAAFCERLANDVKVGNFLEGLARRTPAIFANFETQIAPYSNAVLNKLSPGTIAALVELIATVLSEGALTERNLVKILAIKVATDLLDRRQPRA